MAARARGENEGIMASRKGSATVAPNPRSTVRRGNDFVKKAMSVSLYQSEAVGDLPIKKAGLSTIPKMIDDQR
jgi:hypothetical protein